MRARLLVGQLDAGRAHPDTSGAESAGCDPTLHRTVVQPSLFDTSDVSRRSTRATMAGEWSDERRGVMAMGVEQYLASRNYAATSLKQRRTILTRFAAHVGDPATVDADTFLEWWSTTERLAPASRRATFIAVRGFLDWLVEAGERHDNPARLVRTPTVPRTPPKVLSSEQVASLRQVIDNDQDSLMIELMLTTGLRVAEVAALNADDLDRELGALRVHGKGSKVALIPVPDFIADAWPEPGSGSVFGMRVDRIRKRTKDLLAAAGAAGHTPHSLRRTCGTELARRAPLHVVAALLRHESVATTGRHYAGVTMDDLRQAIS